LVSRNKLLLFIVILRLGKQGKIVQIWHLERENHRGAFWRSPPWKSYGYQKISCYCFLLNLDLGNKKKLNRLDIKKQRNLMKKEWNHVTPCEKGSILKRSPPWKKLIGVKNSAATVYCYTKTWETRKCEQIGHKEAKKFNEQKMNSCGSMWKEEHFEGILLQKKLNWCQEISFYCLLLYLDLGNKEKLNRLDIKKQRNLMKKGWIHVAPCEKRSTLKQFSLKKLNWCQEISCYCLLLYLDLGNKEKLYRWDIKKQRNLK